jgi:CelD/BcsL family acetyltransferase involved in cellulose biosynthesis
MMQVRCLASLEELTPYAEAWDRLAADVPFRSWTWLSKWWKHYGATPGDPRRRLAVICVFDDAGGLLGVAPWYLDSTAVRGRVLRPLGSGEVCSDYLSVLCQPGREEAVTGALAEYLMGNIRESGGSLRWDLMELDGIDSDDRPMALLAEQLATLGCSFESQSTINCWRIELPTTWDEYFTGLGKHLRRDGKRLDRELLEKNRATLHVINRLDDLPRAMDILVDLHQQRREMLGEKGCFASDRFLAFYLDVAPEMLRRGMAQFYWMEIDGQPAAAEYHLQGGGTLYVYQAGLARQAMQHKPGNLLNLMLVRYAIEHGYRAYDFLRGDEVYKSRFAARPRPSMIYRIVPPVTSARLRHNLWQAGRNVKQWVTGARDEGHGAREEKVASVE